MAATQNKDYYELLGVAQDASAEDIKKAFRTKARTMHPDVSKEPGAEERFKEISEAYDTLSDPGKRARYDAVRAGGFTTENPFRGAANGSPYASPQDPFGWASWGYPFGGAYSSNTRSTSGAGVPYAVEQGATRRITMQLSAEEAKRGCVKTVSYQHLESCAACKGKGAVDSSSIDTCSLCHGTGEVQLSIGGLISTPTRCPSCAGSGQVIKNPCSQCAGKGTTQAKIAVKVAIPPGSHDGGSTRVPGMGDAGRCGGASGDLQVDFEVPSEHLTQGQEAGFTIAGVITAAVLCTLFAGTVMKLFAFFALPLFFVFFFVSPSLFKSKGGSFWQRAARRFGYGCVLGVFVFVLFSPAMACMSLL